MMACMVKEESVLKEIQNLFAIWLQDPTLKPHPEIRELVYKYGKFVLLYI